MLILLWLCFRWISFEINYDRELFCDYTIDERCEYFFFNHSESAKPITVLLLGPLRQRNCPRQNDARSHNKYETMCSLISVKKLSMLDSNDTWRHSDYVVWLLLRSQPKQSHMTLPATNIISNEIFFHPPLRLINFTGDPIKSPNTQWMNRWNDEIRELVIWWHATRHVICGCVDLSDQSKWLQFTLGSSTTAINSRMFPTHDHHHHHTCTIHLESIRICSIGSRAAEAHVQPAEQTFCGYQNDSFFFCCVLFASIYLVHYLCGAQCFCFRCTFVKQNNFFLVQFVHHWETRDIDIDGEKQHYEQHCHGSESHLCCIYHYFLSIFTVSQATMRAVCVACGS